MRLSTDIVPTLYRLLDQEIALREAINERDYAYNLTGGVGKEMRTPITAGERIANQQMIREQIEQIAAFFHFDTQPSQ